MTQYLDFDLEQARTQPKPRPSRASPEKRSSPKPSEQRWRWAEPEDTNPVVTEKGLHEALAKLYNSLCSLDWWEVRLYGATCGEVWNALPAAEYERIRPDYPTAPPHDCYPEEWIGYGTWWLLFWHRELPEALKSIALKPSPLMRRIPEKTKDEMALVAARRYGPKGE